jgi:hypothetical protein
MINPYMNMPASIKSKSPGFYLGFFAIALLGLYLRLDQFSLQVLLDDEWHVLHQMLSKSPGELVQTFGLADFSIPLALLYWCELKLFGLSEMGMRWPMMLAGIVFLVLSPLYVRRYFGGSIALLFMLLISISPRLVIYSKTARPYALTLLLSLLAVGLFQKFFEAEKSSLRWGFLYVLCAVTSSWLHLISLPLVVAPFAVYGLPALLKRDWQSVGRLFKLGLVTLAGLLLVVLPPMLGHPEALVDKMGAQLPEIQSYYGMLYVWMGTSSLGVVLAGLLLAGVGAGRLWRQLPITISVLTGMFLTLVLILLTQPAWVQYPVTLARYLLPALPLFLLAVAVGASVVSDKLVKTWGKSGQYASVAILLSLMTVMVFYSPLPKMLAKPNSNSLHSVYQFDYRQDKNLIIQYQDRFPVSPFWQKLATLPADSIKIVASPFSFETHHWDAARWEQISRQRIMPGYLTGFCDGFWWGEVPRERGFRFKNVGYLSDQNDLIQRGFDLLVFQKPISSEADESQGFALTAGHCEPKIREKFPAPVYEDQWLIVFPLSENVRGLIDAER